MSRPDPKNRYEAMTRWPRVVAHMIAESLGYCTPSSAAQIVLDGKLGKENWCEWLDACYRGNAKVVLQKTIRSRHYHRGYMSSYKTAKMLIYASLAERGKYDPAFASWF
jgi:hypothetical protein